MYRSKHSKPRGNSRIWNVLISSNLLNQNGITVALKNKNTIKLKIIKKNNNKYISPPNKLKNNIHWKMKPLKGIPRLQG